MTPQEESSGDDSGHSTWHPFIMQVLDGDHSSVWAMGFVGLTLCHWHYTQAGCSLLRHSPPTASTHANPGQTMCTAAVHASETHGLHPHMQAYEATFLASNQWLTSLQAAGLKQKGATCQSLTGK